MQLRCGETTRRKYCGCCDTVVFSKCVLAMNVVHCAFWHLQFYDMNQKQCKLVFDQTTICIKKY